MKDAMPLKEKERKNFDVLPLHPRGGPHEA